jgi:hypothetical protein
VRNAVTVAEVELLGWIGIIRNESTDSDHVSRPNDEV